MGEEASPVVEAVLQEFFAVTKSGSLYHIRNERLSDGTPMVEKVALCGESKIQQGGFLKGPHGDGSRIGITHWEGLDIYWPRNDVDDTLQPPSKTTQGAGRFGGHTTPIVALFLKQDEAEKCLACYPRFGEWDLRWESKTRAVLKAIGKHHPMFTYDPLGARWG